MLIPLFLFHLFFNCHLFGDICYFIPPANYAIVDSKTLPSQVLIGFVKKSHEQFKPSINLATEKIKGSFDEYILAVKNMYHSKRNTFVKDLGFIQTKKGPAKLLEITKKIDSLTIYQLQQIFFFKNQIYILTAAFSKTDFLKEKDEIVKAFASLNIIENLLDEISCEEQKQLNQIIKKTKSFKKLKIHFKENYSHLGLYWKYLTLKTIQEKFNSP